MAMPAAGYYSAIIFCIYDSFDDWLSSLTIPQYLILLIWTISDNPRQSKYGNPIARIGGIPQSYYLAAIALFNVLRTPANIEDYAYK
jgi:hypothetical protein